MVDVELQTTCERGQQELMETRYLEAASTLAQAENRAWVARDFSTLARLYLPLQETRRQIRQRCGEGAVRMHLLNQSAEEILNQSTHGQLLVAAAGSIQTAVDVRRLATDRNLYLETFLAAAYQWPEAEPITVIVPNSQQKLPEMIPPSERDLRAMLSPYCLVLSEKELPVDSEIGSSETFAAVMTLWEKLHTPYLHAAEQIADPIQRMQAYRVTLEVDRACELAHQYLADIARMLSRQR